MTVKWAYLQRVKNKGSSKSIIEVTQVGGGGTHFCDAMYAGLSKKAIKCENL